MAPDAPRIVLDVSYVTKITIARVIFVAAAIIGEAQLSFFLAGVVLGEIWYDKRRGKCFIQ